MCFTHSEAVHVCEGWSRFCRIEVFLHSLSEELKNLFIKHFSLYFMKPVLILSGLNTADLSLWARRCSSCPVSERGEAGGGVMVGCWIFPPKTELVFIFWTRVERNLILVILTLVPFFPFLPPLLVSSPRLLFLLPEVHHLPQLASPPQKRENRPLLRWSHPPLCFYVAQRKCFTLIIIYLSVILTCRGVFLNGSRIFSST